MELSSRGRIAFVCCLNVAEEHWKRDSIVESMMKDNDKVVFARGRGYVTKVDWGAMKCVFCVKVEASNEISRRIIDRLPLLGSPLEIERGMYDLSPTTDFDREVE